MVRNSSSAPLSAAQVSDALAADLALVELHPGRGERALLRERGPREAFLQVAEHARGLVDVAGLRRLLERVVHGAGLDALVALPPVPAVPRREGAQQQHQQPGDQVAVLLPERLDRVELFLLLQVELCGHRVLLRV
jgi:hypothetical protein